MSEDPNFNSIIRIANSDVSGEQRLGYALTSIRGIGSRISNAIIQKLNLDSEKLAGKLTDKNIEDIEKAIERDNFLKPEDAKNFGLIDHVVDTRNTSEK